MSLHLSFSNRVEPLLDAISEALDRHWTDVAFPPEVVVPSPAIAKWLKLRLCERRAVLLNLPTPTLEGFLWRSLGAGEAALLKGHALAQALVPLLGPTLLEDSRYGRVKDFLVRDGAINPRRRVQLAQELSRLFLEYEYNRPSVWAQGKWAVPGMDRSWPKNPYFTPAAETETERWQRDLYGRVFESGGVLERRGLLSLPALHRRRHGEGWEPSGGPVFLFLVDKVSHFHRNLLMELSQGREVHLFLQNPCSEFWEDLDTRRRPATRRNVRFPSFGAGDYGHEFLSKEIYSATDDAELPDPLLLRRWGNTERENIALWSQATDYDFDFLVDPPLGPGRDPTALALLQQCLLMRHPGPGERPLELDDGRILSEPMPKDESIQILAAPERGREMESVRDSVLEWLSEDPSRSPSDCLVLLADPARARTEVHRVFGGAAPSDPGWIPWTFLGEPGRESRFARGVEALGNLAVRGMDRAGVFELLRNPLCQARLGVDSATVLGWERWAEGSGMLRGWDAFDRKARGDAQGWDTHTFKAGILRLYAARLADQEVSLDLETAASQVRLPGWRDFDSSDPGALEAFAAALERLHEDLGRVGNMFPSRDIQKLGRVWTDFVEAWLETSGTLEDPLRLQWREGMELLALQEGRGEPMDADELVELTRSFLPEEVPGSARAFAGSLTFAPLRIGNLVPHGLVVVAGLEADAFPRTVQRTSLDLLGLKRLVGDADPAQDDRHTFLSVVLSSRSRLVLSWKAEDLQKDREIEPSSVLQELRTALESVSPVSVRSVRLLAREPGLPRKDYAPWPVESWDPSDAVQARSPGTPAWERLDASLLAPDGARRFTLAQLKAFLQNPFVRHVHDALGLEEEDLPDTGACDEALETDKLERSRLRRGIFQSLAASRFNGPASDPEQLVRRALERFSWEGKCPEGELFVREVTETVAWARGVDQALERLRDDFPDGMLRMRSDFSLGRAGIDPVLRREKGDTALEVVGSVPLVLCGASRTVILTLSRLSDKSEPDTSQRLEGWLSAACLAEVGAPGLEIVHVSREIPKKDVWTALERPTDLSPWLWTLVQDLSNGACEFLPSREILGGARTFAALREKVEDNDYANELERLFRPPLPGEQTEEQDALDALVSRRLGPFFAKSGGGEADDV